MCGKRIISAVVALMLMLSMSFVTAYADDVPETVADITDQYEACAEQLYIYGLFKGGTSGFDLDSDSTRAQAAVMVVRLLGAEDQVLSQSFSHPYTDVPDWASNYVGYLYQNGIDISIDSTTFGADENITCGQYAVLLIQALGYTTVNVQMTAEEIEAACVRVGLLTETEVSQVLDTEFDRGTMVFMASKALHTGLCQEGEDYASGVTLYDSLLEAGIIQSLAAPDDSVKYGTVASLLAAATEAAKPELGETIIAKGKTNLGIRYRSGGKSPSTGFDCSGFVGYTMIQSGVWSKFYGSCDGVKSQCTTVSMAEAKPGDIVFFKGTYRSSHTYTHVGIYMGNGMMIHSASSSGVSISSFTSGYWASHYSCIARPTVLM